PVRTSKTSALYPPSAVELLKLIKTYQDERRMTLEEIADLFRRHDYDPSTLERGVGSGANGRSALAVGTGGQWITREDLILALDPGPEAKWLDELVECGLLQPETVNGKLQFPPSSMQLVKTVWDGVQMGATLSQFAVMSQLVSQQAERELGE